MGHMFLVHYLIIVHDKIWFLLDHQKATCSHWNEATIQLEVLSERVATFNFDTETQQIKFVSQRFTIECKQGYQNMESRTAKGGIE